MADSHTRQIYVALLDGGSHAWRRVDAHSEGGDAYRITSENGSERWEYTTGQVVRCRPETLGTGERVLVATQLIRGMGE